ncbi:nicotinate-nucleotide--dimethylbenzimidazole phosphoribosyltransferase [Salibacterium salarium]|uniref:Nicotinate-nucleotide--dimethylbenzimidazole phosphoribosyltransferase n=2 Tax=Salibacterium salarium TaxID=284579 RepID=A0A3R9RED0_9BACI|nr:nicotinate-nucleotide--dimethylbenzimidazole phosphoribosyltransferase [Salibacterium salarium]RSL33587.1 nicotinate-nucleotide--dimethylbenzimidazole phosphoribosyltransferase [Salibacterium salarium]
MAEEELRTGRIPRFDSSSAKETRTYIETLTKPPGSLGRLEEIAIELAGITKKPFPVVDPPGILVFAADHGIAAEGVSAFPQEITGQMAQNFLRGGASINVLARQIGAAFQLIDIGMAQDIQDPMLISRKIKTGTANFLTNDAMTRQETIKAVHTGFDEATIFIKENGLNSLILGEMGIANTTASSAVIAALGNLAPESVTGQGTGLSPDQVLHKQNVIRQAFKTHTFSTDDPIDVLSKVGGLEIAGMTGAMLAAATQRTPILIDGFISSTAAVAAAKLEPAITDFMFVGHHSTEPGHRVANEWLNKEPILHLGMRLGEGSGASLAYPILQSACAIVHEMATFRDLENY